MSNSDLTVDAAAPRPCSWREFQLATGETVLVDAGDYEILTQYRWYRSRNRPNGQLYAHAYKNGQHVRMHRLLLDAPIGMQVDHINGNTLDNRRSNLRLATHAQNKWNTPKQRSAGKRSSLHSQFKGVFQDRDSGGWIAQIGSRPRRHLGTFRSEEAAGRAYDTAAKEIYGEFAVLNFSS